MEGDPRNVVHVNTLLIEADSPERAYKKARALGREAETVYENSDGKDVRVIFRGSLLGKTALCPRRGLSGAKDFYFTESHVAAPPRIFERKSKSARRSGAA